MSYTRTSLQTAWASLLRRSRSSASTRYPEARAGMSPEQARSFLRLIDLRLEELERSQREDERRGIVDRARDARVERRALEHLRGSFLELLAPREHEG